MRDQTIRPSTSTHKFAVFAVVAPSVAEPVWKRSEARRSPSQQTLRGLDWLNFFLADVQTGVGPFLAIFLAGYGWNEQRVGIILTAGGIAGSIVHQFGFNAGFLFLAAVAAIAFGILYRFVPETHREVSP